MIKRARPFSSSKGFASLAVALTLSVSPAHAQDAATDPAKLNPERPPATLPDPKSLEGGMWATTAKAELKAKTSGERNHDPALNAYISSVLTRISGPYAPEVRAYVMDRPYFNASMAPNGYTEVWTGLLLRCETEDQLAFVLAHEASHFRHSDSLRNYQSLKDGQNAALAASLVISVLAVGAMSNATSYSSMNNIGNISSGLIDIVYLGSIAAFFSYSRETENSADAFGNQYVKKAGYSTRAGISLWQARLNETAASDFEKVRKSPTRINIFGDHPLEAARIDALEKQVRTLHANGADALNEAEEKTKRAAYRDHIRPYLSAWLRDELRRADFGQTLFTLETLGRDGLDQGLLDFYAGESYRLRADSKTSKSGDLDNAVLAYRRALKSPDAPIETWRQLGDVHRHLNDRPAAIDALTNYIKLAPKASDAWMVQDQIDNLIAQEKTPPTPLTPPPTQSQAITS